MKVIVSMATIPCRKDRLKRNIPSFKNQTYPFDMLIINVLDNLTEEDYQFYEELKKMDSRIVINKADGKWRSCNKLIPTLKRYPDDIIITVDDDIYYPNESISTLMQQYELTPDCIIAQDVHPISLERNNTYINHSFPPLNVRLMQKEWGKYVTCCCLFPPHVFDGSDIFDFDKMMAITKGQHDEVWFWINSMLNGVQCVGLNYVRNFWGETLTNDWDADALRLCKENSKGNYHVKCMDSLNKLYGKRLLPIILGKKAKFTVTKDNIYSFVFCLPHIRQQYKNHFTVEYKGLTKGWKKYIRDIMLGGKVTL